jgi:hypothetical protein
VSQKYAAEAAIKIGVDSKGVKTGVSDVKKDIDGLKDSVKRAGEVFAGTFGSAALLKGLDLTKRGISAVADEIGKWFKAAGEAERGQAKLEASFRAQSISMDRFKDQIETAKDAMWDYAGVAGDTVTKALADLVTYTGNAEKSLQSLPHLFDVMADSGMDISTAAKLMAQAWEGNTGALGRYVPALREMSAEAAKSGEFLKVLTQFLGGQATADTNTFVGSIGTLTDIVRQLRAYMGEPITDALTPGIGEIANKVRDLIKSGDLDETRNLLGQIAGNLVATAGALWGGVGGRQGVIDGIEALLKQLEGYTRSKDFADDLRDIALAARQAGEALAAVYQIMKFLKNLSQVPSDFLQATGAGGPMSGDFWDAFGGAMEERFGTGKARGGVIPGRARRPGDNMLIPMRSGEFVVNENATRAYRPFLEMLNRSIPAGNTAGQGPGLARGGSPEYWINYIQKQYGGMQNLGGFNSAGLDWIISQMKLGAQGYVNLMQARTYGATGTPMYAGAAGAAAALMQRWVSPREIEEARSALYSGMIAAMPAALSGLYAQRAADRAAFMGGAAPAGPGRQVVTGAFTNGSALWQYPEVGDLKSITYGGSSSLPYNLNLLSSGRNAFTNIPGMEDEMRRRAAYYAYYGSRMPGGGYGPGYASGGIVGGRRGDPQWILAHGGEKVMHPDAETSDRELLGVVKRILVVLESRQSGPQQMQRYQEPVASEEAVGRGLVKMLERTGYDLPWMKRETEKSKRKTPGAQS